MTTWQWRRWWQGEKCSGGEAGEEMRLRSKKGASSTWQRWLSHWLAGPRWGLAELRSPSLPRLARLGRARPRRQAAADALRFIPFSKSVTSGCSWWQQQDEQPAWRQMRPSITTTANYALTHSWQTLTQKWQFQNDILRYLSLANWARGRVGMRKGWGTQDEGIGW